MRARAFAVAGHVAVLVSLALPWVGGEFGSRETLSAFQLTAMLERAMPRIAAWETALGWVLPAVALQAALAWPVGTVLRLGPVALRAIEFVLSAVVALVALAVGAGALIVMQSGDLVTGPRVGTLLALLGSSSVLLARPDNGPASRALTTREERTIRGRVMRSNAGPPLQDQ
jgi:hypothetical protein